jgi:hypothetical protein
VGIHIDDAVISPSGKLDIAGVRPLARMGYLDYTSVTEVFELRPGGTTADIVIGMSGGRAAVG